MPLGDGGGVELNSRPDGMTAARLRRPGHRDEAPVSLFIVMEHVEPQN